MGHIRRLIDGICSTCSGYGEHFDWCPELEEDSTIEPYDRLRDDARVERSERAVA